MRRPTLQEFFNAMTEEEYNILLRCADDDVTKAERTQALMVLYKLNIENGWATRKELDRKYRKMGLATLAEVLSR